MPQLDNASIESYLDDSYKGASWCGTSPSDASVRVVRALEDAGLEAWFVGKLYLGWYALSAHAAVVFLAFYQ